MFQRFTEGACILFCALIIFIAACASPGNASSYIHTSYGDFIQGNADGNVVFGRDGEIALSKQVGTAVGGFKLVGQLPFEPGEAWITAGRGCLYAGKFQDTCIYQAPILEDGAIGECQAVDLTPGRTVFGEIAVVGDFIYVAVRGYVDSDTGVSFLYARLDTDGGIGAWREYTGYGECRNVKGGSGGLYVTRWAYGGVGRLGVGPMGDLYDQQAGMSNHQIMYSSLNVLDGLVYQHNGTPLANITYGPLGEYGPPLWTKTAFPLPRSYRSLVTPSAVAVGGCLLGFGGYDSHVGIWYMMNGVASMLDPNGDPQVRHVVASLPRGMASAGVTSWGDYIYIAGGASYINRWTNGLYAAKIIEDGIPSPWVETSSMPVYTGYHQVVATDSHVYTIGGQVSETQYGYLRSSARVLSAPIVDTGGLGEWTDTAPLPEERIYHAAVLHGDSIYVAGGMGAGGIVSTAVWRSGIRPDGSLEAWETLTPLPEKVWGHSLVVHGGYLYCVYGAATDLYRWPTESPVYSAPILSDGTLGNWTKVSMLPQGLVRDISAVVNGRLYVIGGEWLGKLVYSAPLTSDGGVGEWTRQADLPCGTRGHAVVAYNGSLHVIGGEMSLYNIDQFYPEMYGLPSGYVTMRGTPDTDGNISEWEVLAPTPYPNDSRTGLALSGDTLYFVGGTHLIRDLQSNKAYYSRIHTPETELPTVSGGRYVGNFRLEQDEPMVSLHWSGDFGEGSGATVRYRTAEQDDTAFGAWSEFSGANPLPIGRTAAHLQYEIRLVSANGNPAAVDSIRLVTDTTPPSLTLRATPDVLWPANGSLVPVTINGSATDTESGIERVQITITDEYGEPCEQITGFGQTVHLQASRLGNDQDGRLYMVRAVAVDRAGNENRLYAMVICPHDQGNTKKLPRRSLVPPRAN